MDDYRRIIKEALDEQARKEAQEIRERAVNGLLLVAGLPQEDVDQTVDRETVRNLFAALYAPMKSLHGENGMEAVYTALMACYYVGFKAGQEAQSEAAADDTNGAEWGL